MKKLTCPNCDVELQSLSNFCPQCGTTLHIISKEGSGITPFRFLTLVAVCIGLFLFGWIAQSKLSGKKPEKIFNASASGINAPIAASMTESQMADEATSTNVDYNDPELNKIRSQTQQKPLDIDIQRNFSKLLLQKIRKMDPVPQALVFETIDTLRNILNLNPKDPEALIAMADISFDQQAFAKAIEFYKKYLDVEKNDLNARSRYASSLTFIGKHDEAIAELSSVLEIDPKNFHANAYSAITYAQMGKIDEAHKFGNQALKLAPSPEAKERFSQFLKQLDAPKPTNERNNTEPSNPIIDYIKNSQVAGPKYRSFEINNRNELIVNFENFPMKEMPQFAKDKFFTSLKEAAASSAIKPARIIFKDASEPAIILDILEID